MTTSHKRHAIVTALAAAALASTAACGGTTRNVATYRADTANLLETRSAVLRTCYEEVLKADPNAGGTVTVQFLIRTDTGMIQNPTVDPARSTAAPELGRCVISAIDGLVLEPADKNEGRATYVYEFRPDTAPTATPAS